jgi:hypothetical protein
VVFVPLQLTGRSTPEVFRSEAKENLGGAKRNLAAAVGGFTLGFPLIFNLL